MRQCVGVLGASSLVGECLLALLIDAGWEVKAFSRKARERTNDKVEWQSLLPQCGVNLDFELKGLSSWICTAPIWVLPEYFSTFEAAGARRIVVISSTSLFTKSTSSDAAEIAMASRFKAGENMLKTWAEGRGIDWVILRPTLIYGLGRDKNISEIARFIRRFGFFPVFGNAAGLRQPIHAQDVAYACAAALQAPVAANHAYNISGGETLSYRDMVTRIFDALGLTPRLLPVPLSFFRVGVALLRCMPRYRSWSPAMAERMNNNLVFDHSDAARDFGFSPRPFNLTESDLFIR